MQKYFQPRKYLTLVAGNVVRKFMKENAQIVECVKNKM